MRLGTRASATRFGVQNTPHEVFNDYSAKVDKLDIKTAVARGSYEERQPLLLIIVSATEVPWPYPPRVTGIPDAIEDEEALKVKEWLVSRPKRFEVGFEDGSLQHSFGRTEIYTEED